MTTNEPYIEAATALGGVLQRFQYGFGGYIDVMLTLLQKQHWQAAADIIALIEREKTQFEGVLLGLQIQFAEKGAAKGAGDREEAHSNGNGTFSGEAADPGAAPA